MASFDINNALKIEVLRNFKKLPREIQMQYFATYLRLEGLAGWKRGLHGSGIGGGLTKIERSDAFIQFLIEEGFGIKSGKFDIIAHNYENNNNDIFDLKVYMANFNMTNLSAIAGGAVALFWSAVGWKNEWRWVPMIGGTLSIGLGLADAFGIMEQLKSKFSSNYANTAVVGGYAVTANNLPFDPNNYYLPPRDRSIAP